MTCKKHLIRIATAILLLVAPVASQTSNELHQRYGPPDTERYEVRPGIVMTVSFTEVGQPCEVLIEPKHSILSRDVADQTMPVAVVTEIIDEVVPLYQRGLLINSVTFSGSCVATVVSDYEQIIISRAVNGCVKETDNKTVSASIRWKAATCR